MRSRWCWSSRTKLFDVPGERRTIPEAMRLLRLGPESDTLGVRAGARSMPRRSTGPSRTGLPQDWDTPGPPRRPPGSARVRLEGDHREAQEGER